MWLEMKRMNECYTHNILAHMHMYIGSSCGQSVIMATTILAILLASCSMT